MRPDIIFLIDDVILPHPRKLVNLLVDVEEWGQVTLLNMLTRYARTQFINPNIGLDFPCEVRLLGSREESRVAGFFVLPPIRTMDYFRLG